MQNKNLNEVGWEDVKGNYDDAKGWAEFIWKDGGIVPFDLYNRTSRAIAGAGKGFKSPTDNPSDWDEQQKRLLEDLMHSFDNYAISLRRQGDKRIEIESIKNLFYENMKTFIQKIIDDLKHPMPVPGSSRLEPMYRRQPYP
jgi:hypothetical protein